MVLEKTGAIRWKHEVYLDFDYNAFPPDFHFFEGDEKWFAFKFSKPEEASPFYKTIIKESVKLEVNHNSAAKRNMQFGNSVKNQLLEETYGGKEQLGVIKEPSLNKEQPNNIRLTKSYESAFPSDDAVSTNSSKSSESLSSKKSKGKSSFFSLFSRKSSSKKSAEISIQDIGAPTDFQHLAHIGFNPLTGKFDSNNIPSEWQSLFKSAGVSDKDLENTETATFIAGFVNEQLAQNTPPKLPPKPKNLGRNNLDSEAASPNTERPPQAPNAPPLPTFNIPANQNGEEELPIIGDDSRSQLMASIRNAGANGKILKPVPKVEKSTHAVGNPQSDALPGDMASMLAAALAQRRKKPVLD